MRNFSARACPKAQPVMQATAWVAQQSISTKVIKQTLAVFTVSAFDAEFLKSEHRHAHADEIARAEVTVRAFGIAEIFVERFQV